MLFMTLVKNQPINQTLSYTSSSSVTFSPDGFRDRMNHNIIWLFVLDSCLVHGSPGFAILSYIHTRIPSALSFIAFIHLQPGVIMNNT